VLEGEGELAVLARVAAALERRREEGEQEAALRLLAELEKLL
jgi:hypothetical protein